MTIAWTATNVTAASLNQGIGAVAPLSGGSVTKAVTADTTFIMTVTGPGGTATCADSVDVGNPVVAPVCVAFTATPTSLPSSGGSVKLAWNVTGATKVTIDHGVGQFLSNVTSTNVNVTQDTTFTLTAENSAGVKVSCAVSVDVQNGGGITPNCDLFTVSDSDVEPGDSITLTWQTTNANSVSINQGVGSNLPADGSITVNAQSNEGSQTFTLTATRSSQTDTCAVTINVDDDDGGGGGGPANPRCEFDISDRSIRAGDEVELSWETRFANEVTIYEGHDDDGDVVFRTTDDDEVEDGETTVRPDRDTEYTLVAERGSRDRVCRVEVDVEDDIVVLSDRFQEPTVAGITLTQVPYTGFDAGPTLTAIFYALLALWGAFVAYFYIYKREPKIAGVPNGITESREEFEKKVKRLTDLYTGRNW